MQLCAIAGYYSISSAVAVMRILFRLACQCCTQTWTYTIRERRRPWRYRKTG